MTIHQRKGSKDNLDILSKESTDSSSSMESIELKQQQQHKKQRSKHHHVVKSSKSPPSFIWIAIALFTALLVLSPAKTLAGNRSLLENDTTRSTSSSLRTTKEEHISVAKVVNNNNHQQVQKIPPSEALSKATAEATSPARGRRPTILIHIGPPKTGTTTLQCHLGLNFANMVQNNNYYYLGTWYAPLCGLPLDHTIPGFQDVPRPILLDCYAPHIHKECNMDERWRDFGDVLQKHYDMGHNLIVSDEMFHHHFQLQDVQRLKSLLVPNWNVKILYTYRHFYSSVPSMYHQLNDPYATEEGMANAVEKTIWPNEGGYRILPFRVSNNFDIQSDMKRFSYWVEEFGTVHVFNMDSSSISKEGGYLSSFLCTMMPELKTSLACQQEDHDHSIGSTTTTALSDSSTTIARNDNGSDKKFLHYDMLAVAAKDAGFLDDSSLQRTEVRDAIQQHCEQNGWEELSSFALDCLSDEEMESFLQESLDQAKMMQEYFVPRNQHQNWPVLESEIRTAFAQHAERKQFCSIDTETTLQEERWKTFFDIMTNRSQLAKFNDREMY